MMTLYGDIDVVQSVTASVAKNFADFSSEELLNWLEQHLQSNEGLDEVEKRNIVASNNTILTYFRNWNGAYFIEQRMDSIVPPMFKGEQLSVDRVKQLLQVARAHSVIGRTIMEENTDENIRVPPCKFDGH